MKKPALILTFLILTIIALFGVRVAVSNGISTSGVELGKLEEVTGKYKTQNAILREKIFALSSLSFISEKAAKLGFVESKSNFAVSLARPIAKNR